MAETLTLKIEGGAELAAALRSLSDDMSKKVARAAAMSGAAVIRAEAKRLAEAQGLKKSGSLIANIAVKRERAAPGEYVYHVGVRHGKGGHRKGTNDPWYWFLHEFGTSRMPARPFLRPAFEQARERAIARALDVLKKRIERAQAEGR